MSIFFFIVLFFVGTDLARGHPSVPGVLQNV